MARIRTIKPEFFTSEDIVSLTPLSRLFYVSLWCEADREGRLSWSVKTLKMRYFPGDNCDIEAMAQELIDAGLIVVYEVEGRKYAEIPQFKVHQVINNRESESVIPARVKDASSTRESGGSGEGKGKEGKGKEVASKREKPETPIPENFAISDSVRQWAGENGFDRLEQHLSHFVDTAKAKGYKYRDWDAAFRNAIKGNWAKLKEQQKPVIAGDPAEIITLPDGQKVTRAGLEMLRRFG